jgi:hypothetical protein
VSGGGAQEQLQFCRTLGCENPVPHGWKGRICYFLQQQEERRRSAVWGVGFPVLVLWGRVFPEATLAGKAMPGTFSLGVEGEHCRGHSCSWGAVTRVLTCACEINGLRGPRLSGSQALWSQAAAHSPTLSEFRAGAV